MLNKFVKYYNKLSLQVKAAIWFMVCSFMQKGISVITTPIFTRLLTTSEYGQFNVFNSWLGILTIFVTLRMYHGSYTQGLVKYDEKKEQYASSMQGLNLLLCLAWTVLYLLFHTAVNNALSLTTVQMLCMFVMIWSTAVFGFWSAEQRVVLKYRELVILTVIVSLAKPIIGVIFVRAASDKVTARILGLALVEFLGYSWLFVNQIRRGKKLFDGFFWKRAIALNTPLILHFLSMTVLNSSDRIMISRYVGDDKAGIYSLAYQISQVMTLFSTTLNQTITPWIYKKIKENQTKDISRIANICLFIIAAANILLILIGPEVVKLFAPPAYYEAIWIIPPVALSVVFMFSYDLFAKFEFYYEKTYYVMIASTFGAITNIIMNYFCIRVFGYIAAAYTTLFCYILYSLAHYIAMKYISHKYMNDQRIFNGTALMQYFSGFTIIGLLLTLTYKNIVVRYALILVSIVLCVVFRHQIYQEVKKVTSLRKRGKEATP